MSKKIIRDYSFQLDAIHCIKRDYNKKKNARMLLIIPTGGGKTLTAIRAVDEMIKDNVINQNNYDSQLVPQLFVLYQNYPNPFNGQTKITFDLLENAKLSLYITDAKGRVQDRILEEEFYNSGMYSFLWDAEHLSSGIYFISLQAEVDHLPPALISRKMIFLK